MTEEKIDLVCKVFMSIKENWLKSGDFTSLVDLICANLDLEKNEDLIKNLKKSNALWLNNHLDSPLDDDPEAEVIKEKPKKNKKNHDHH
jgi:hypothetical protein